MKPEKEKLKTFSNSRLPLAAELQILSAEVHQGFRRIDQKFESLQREIGVRFESQQREIQTKFATINWALGFGFTIALGFLGAILKYVMP